MKYVLISLFREERNLDIESLAQIIKERNLFAEEVYELAEIQIKREEMTKNIVTAYI